MLRPYDNDHGEFLVVEVRDAAAGRRLLASDGRQVVARVGYGCQGRPGELLAAIDEETFTASLDTAGMPDPDLLIRTGGESRVSNFLLWQSAYAEMVFMDVLWPDADRRTLWKAIEEYASRNRRFGKA